VSSGTPATGMTIATPGDWIAIDLGASDEEIAAIVDARAEQLPQLSDSRAEAVRLMKQVRDVSDAVGIIFAAVMFEVIEDVPVVASMTISAGPLAFEGEEPAPGGDRLEAMATALRAANDSGRRLEDASIVELPAGRAVRVQQMQPSDGPTLPEPQVMTFSVQYLVPLERDESLVAITFSTPTMALADEFVPLFDGIAATFELRPPAQSDVRHARSR
jgi:hypothetical protein